ncbi:FAD:protein FMN transferase [Paenibacillus agricola]|uniref:FAD:protein FMN transferase n=1 Tax=Paenibacillus agricola TaxID=2716264 RepID=A0ABX0J9B7_9BACL|nr:FAD:protein FMN transferase [Paenibacillus agricola]NHN30596.1 FAD:protein FMN transferase [Paenibacillus agricola]
MIAKPSDQSSERFYRFHFQALNTNVDLLIWAESHEIAVIERMAIEWFRDTEARFSRHHPQSELNLLNTLAGERCKVSDMMLEVLALTETYRKITHDAFNPLVLSAADTSLHLSLDSDTKSVRLPTEAQLNLDSIVQNWILQRLADLLQHRLKLKQGLLQVGGSYQVWGRPSESFDPWLIEIHQPEGSMEVTASLSISEGAVVTYIVEGQENRMLDEQNVGNYDGGELKQITVTGNDAVECGIWAQAVRKLGVDKGLTLLAQQAAHCEALLLTTESELHYYGNKASLGTKWSEIEVDYYH